MLLLLLPPMLLLLLPPMLLLLLPPMLVGSIEEEEEEEHIITVTEDFTWEDRVEVAIIANLVFLNQVQAVTAAAISVPRDYIPGGPLHPAKNANQDVGQITKRLQVNVFLVEVDSIKIRVVP